MRKLLLIIMLILLVVPSAFAGRKKSKAGKVSDYVYTDNKYNFSITLNEEWKYKIQKDDRQFRFVLTQIKFAVPAEYSSTPDYTKIPRMVMYVVKTKLGSKAFIDSLISPTYNSKAKKEILKEAEILNMNSSTGFTPEKLLSRNKKTVELSDRNGSSWTGQVKYTNEVSLSASSQGGKRVKGSYGGGIVAIEDGENMVVFHIISEWNYFDAVYDDALSIITSINFN